MAGKQESIQVLQQMTHDLSEYRVTVRDEAGGAGRALKVVERRLGFVPRVLGSHGKAVRERRGQVCAVKGGKESGQKSSEEVRTGQKVRREGVDLSLMRRNGRDRQGSC